MSEVRSLKPREAHEFLKAHPNALLVDVRSNMEHLFVGHPVGSVHIAWIDEPDWKVNPHFVTQVRQAILDHEPRILAPTLRVEALLSDAQIGQHNQISFRITGQLWAQPVPLELLLHTDIDLETGRVDVRELPR
jgi:hypothetical protein